MAGKDPRSAGYRTPVWRNRDSDIDIRVQDTFHKFKQDILSAYEDVCSKHEINGVARDDLHALMESLAALIHLVELYDNLDRATLMQLRRSYAHMNEEIVIEDEALPLLGSYEENPLKESSYAALFLLYAYVRHGWLSMFNNEMNTYKISIPKVGLSAWFRQAISRHRIDLFDDILNVH